MGGLGGRPAPQQHINSDSQVNQSDQAQAFLQGKVGGLQNHYNLLQVDSTALNFIVGLQQGPGPV